MDKEKSAKSNNSQKTKEKTVQELVEKQEQIIAADDTGAKAFMKESWKFPVIVLGAVIYAVGLNVFLRPLHLYSGGMMGFAQLIQEMLGRAGITFGGLNISAIIYYLLNVPGMVLAARKMRKRFIIKSVFAITVITILLSVVNANGIVYVVTIQNAFQFVRYF